MFKSEAESKSPKILLCLLDKRIQLQQHIFQFVMAESNDFLAPSFLPLHTLLTSAVALLYKEIIYLKCGTRSVKSRVTFQTYSLIYHSSPDSVVNVIINNTLIHYCRILHLQHYIPIVFLTFLHSSLSSKFSYGLGLCWNNVQRSLSPDKGLEVVLLAPSQTKQTGFIWPFLLGHREIIIPKVLQ